MAQPSLYARYVLEREGFSTAECPEGFATYRVQGDACYIRDLYVLPDYRKQGVASRLADEIAEVARRANCVRLVGTVDVRTMGHEGSLKTLLAYGFSVASAHEGYLVLHKHLT